MNPKDNGNEIINKNLKLGSEDCKKMKQLGYNLSAWIRLKIKEELKRHE